MQPNTNKINKKFFAVATSLLALSFLPACSLDKASSAIERVATAQTIPNSTPPTDTVDNQTNNSTQSSSALAI
ncbi:MAG: hypothetical protein WBF90_12875 [Rivularia sp. (in: cyanobacteria)]